MRTFVLVFLALCLFQALAYVTEDLNPSFGAFAMLLD